MIGQTRCAHTEEEEEKKYLTCHRSYLVFFLFYDERVYSFGGSNRRSLSKVKFIGCMYRLRDGWMDIYTYTSSISLINTQTPCEHYYHQQSMMIYVFFLVTIFSIHSCFPRSLFTDKEEMVNPVHFTLSFF